MFLNTDNKYKLNHYKPKNK